MLFGQQPVLPGLIDHCVQYTPSNRAIDEVLAVLAKRRRVPYRIIRR